MIGSIEVAWPFARANVTSAVSASCVRGSVWLSAFPLTEKVAENFNKSQVSVDVRNESQVRFIWD